MQGDLKQLNGRIEMVELLFNMVKAMPSHHGYWHLNIGMENVAAR
jgi:hypothetical protein